MRRTAALLALAALLAGGASGQAASGGWTHKYGGGAHSGVTDLGDRTLDVIASYALLEGTRFDLDGIVWTPHGPTGMAVVLGPPNACQVFRILDIETGRTERVGPELPCPDGGGINAYDPSTDALLITIDGAPSDDLLQSWDARTGEVRWKNGPDVTAEAAGAIDFFDWFADDVAIDEATGIVIVPFSMDDAGRHVVQAVRLDDGATEWASSIPSHAFADVRPPGALPPLPGETLEPVAQNVELGTLTITSTGVVVLGVLTNYPPTGVVRALTAWFDLEGNFVDVEVSRVTAAEGTGRAMRPAGSSHAAASGARAALLQGDELLVIDPVNQDALRTPVGREESAFAFLAGTMWSREALVVPRATTALIYPAGDIESPREWPGYEGAIVRTAFLAPPADAYVVASHETKDGWVADLLRIDLASARTIDRVPLPFESGDADERPALLPLGDGRILLVAGRGSAVLLGQSPPEIRPRLALGNAYPAAGEPLVVRADAPPDIRELAVAWGDGVLDALQPGAEASHVYETPGRRVVRVVAAYPDGRTATSEAIVNVGGTPPLQLNALQKAFAPENQNLTFGVLGLAATAIGGLVAYAARHRRKSRLQTDIQELARIRALAKMEPHRAAHQLAAYRVRIEKDLTDGALDDAQFTALSTEALRLLGTLRLRLVGGLEARASLRLRHLLETALEDGTVTPEELREIRATLETETGLRPEDKARLATLLEGWATTPEAPL